MGFMKPHNQNCCEGRTLSLNYTVIFKYFIPIFFILILISTHKSRSTMADKGDRKFSPRYRRQKEADEAESWRSPLGREHVSHERSYSPKTKRGDGNRRAKASLSYSSSEGRAFGQSPSHPDRFQRGSPAERRNWRERGDGPKQDRLGKTHG